MYQIGDRVVYGMHGVCQVVGLEERVVDRKRITYLVMEPVAKESARYMVPAQNQAAMAKLHRLLTREEWDGLLENAPNLEAKWIPEESRRKQYYRDLLSAADRRAILAMVFTLYRHKEAQIAAGKKVHQCDENFLRDGERFLAGEIAVISEQDLPQALAYLRTQLKV